MKVLVPADVPTRRLDDVRAVSAAIEVTTFPVPQRPSWARVSGRVSGWLPSPLRRWIAAHLRSAPGGVGLERACAGRGGGAEVRQYCAGRQLEGRVELPAPTPCRMEAP